DFAILLGFYQLMQTVLPRSAFGYSPRELVDDLDLAVHGDVMLVDIVEMDRRQSMAHQFLTRLARLPDANQVLRQPFEKLRAARCYLDIAPACGNDKVNMRLELARKLQRASVERQFVRITLQIRNDERRTRLIDQDAVRFVDDRKAQAPQQERSGGAPFQLA